MFVTLDVLVDLISGVKRPPLFVYIPDKYAKRNRSRKPLAKQTHAKYHTYLISIEYIAKLNKFPGQLIIGPNRI